MQLTRFAELGLRVLMYLTQTDRDPPVTIQEIARQFAVPHNHLVKVAHKLGKLGWLHTVRGRHGGLRLARPASEMRLGDILRGMEGDTPLVDCEQPPCTLAGRCLLEGVLSQAREQFYQTLNASTLADVCQRQTAQAIVWMHHDYLSQSEREPPGD
jgi:Rrf2 family nitric oxide-sensitive transcriptional repressor